MDEKTQEPILITPNIELINKIHNMLNSSDREMMNLGFELVKQMVGRERIMDTFWSDEFRTCNMLETIEAILAEEAYKLGKKAGEQFLKQRQDMNKRDSLQKLHRMLNSNDEELRNLGLVTLKEVVKSWMEFKKLRGVSFSGSPFFPYKLKSKIRKFGRELKKEWLNKKYGKNGTKSEKEDSTAPTEQ